jgi:hypothetical protein
MTTALLVVNSSRLPGYDVMPTAFYWILPTIIGTPFILRTTKKFTS